MNIQIDQEDIILALEDQDYSHQYYIDLENGKIFWFTEDNFEEDIDGYSQELIDNNPERFISIDPIDSHESFQIMEDFIFTITNKNIQGKLDEALSRKKPFRNFKDELYKYTDVQEKWYKYYEERMKQNAIDWLESKGIKGQLIKKIYGKNDNI
jgi:hypothetical protein